MTRRGIENGGWNFQVVILGPEPDDAIVGDDPQFKSWEDRVADGELDEQIPGIQSLKDDLQNYQ